jgi:predicted phage-related endonuclease
MRIVADSADRTAWLAARQNYVCSSEVAAMLGESKYQDRAALVMLKAGLAEPFTGNETTRHGQYLEEGYFPIAAKREFGWVLEPFGKLVEDAVCPQLAATPDFIMTTPYGRALVQTKSATSQAAEDCKPRRDGTPSEATYANGAPLYYVLQQQAELACTGLEWSSLLVFHAAGGGFKLRSYVTRRHEAVIARIRAEAPKVMAEAECLKAGNVRVAV